MTENDNPFCDNCKESDCTVSNDGTCNLIRRYLKAVEEGVHVCAFGKDERCITCGRKFAS